MTFVFPWPISPGEWLAWWGAVATILFGLAVLLVPSLALAGGLAPGQALPPSARAAIRAYAGGMLIGLGLSAILFAQPLIYAALGFAWLFSAASRLPSLWLDRGNALNNIVFFCFAIAFCAAFLAFPFGYIE